MKRLAAADDEVYRTDQQGEVQLRVHKEAVTVRHKLNPDLNGES